MSSFNCEHCHAMCTDTEFGYVTGCEHYPVNPKHLRQWYQKRLSELYREVRFLYEVSLQNKDGLAEPFNRWGRDIVTAYTINSKLADSQTATVHAPKPE